MRSAEQKREHVLTQNDVFQKYQREHPELGLRLIDVVNEFKARLFDQQSIVEALMELYSVGYVTYPRTDCPYIPKEMVEGIATIICAVDLLVPGSVKDLTINPKSPVFVENFQYPHHAIIPTWRDENWKLPLKSLPQLAQDVYKFVALSYLEVIRD